MSLTDGERTALLQKTAEAQQVLRGIDKMLGDPGDVDIDKLSVRLLSVDNALYDINGFITEILGPTPNANWLSALRHDRASRDAGHVEQAAASSR